MVDGFVMSVLIYINLYMMPGLIFFICFAVSTLRKSLSMMCLEAPKRGRTLIKQPLPAPTPSVSQLRHTLCRYKQDRPMNRLLHTTDVWNVSIGGMKINVNIFFIM